MKRTRRRQALRAPEAEEASGARLFFFAALMVAAFGLAVVRFGEQAELPATAVNPVADSPRVLQRPPPDVQAADPVDESSPARWNDDFVKWVERKYRYLLADAGSLEGRLLKLLLERENVAGLSDAEVRRIENELRALLPAAHYATFRLLRDSDEEQHHLLEFSGGVSNVTPLTAQQQRTVLEIKLRHKQSYDVALRQSGFHRDTLSTAEREYAHGAVAAALRTYRNDYLQEVRQMLGEEQYILLSSYESTEFDRELQRLQRAINAK